MKNTTAFTPDEYDEKTKTTIPFYTQFYQSAVEIIQAYNPFVTKWLDTGCGTGNLYLFANKVFPDTTFILSDPSEEMLKIAQDKCKNSATVHFNLADSQSLAYNSESFDVITAIQSHHYLQKTERRAATENCCRMLKTGGMYITFENILPYSETGQQLALKRWESYQFSRGKSKEQAAIHIRRFQNEYFPITLEEHMELLKDTGFRVTELLWASYMQAGVYAIK